MNILIGCEESQEVTKAFRLLGHNAYSCDILESSGGYPEYHLKMDIFKAICGGELITESFTKINIPNWHIGIFFPDCTFLTCSAEWAYKEQPELKSGKLTGQKRIEARKKAIRFFMDLYNCGIPKIAIENPIGVMSTEFRKPDQIIQPYNFGNDASKSTCLWLNNLPKLTHTQYAEPRVVNGKKRWSNQTDSGQNKLPPSKDRAKLRSKTYPGIAKAMAEQWTNKIL